jgi:two-component system sensor histidine kinase MprB
VSLRRRIAGAAALSVAGAAIAVSVIGYVTTRSHLVGEVRQELRARVRPYLQPHSAYQPRGGAPGGGQPAFGGREQLQGQSQGQPGGDQFGVPPAPEFGAAPGYFQIVHRDGTAFDPSGGDRRLPVDPRVVQVARQAHGSFFTDATVDGVHLEVLTVGDPYDKWAVQVALPLTGVDSVLHGLLLPYGLLIAVGVAAALLLGLAISRSALAPIERFLRKTEDVSSELDRPQRLEETGPIELRRLAVSFNRTLDALERSIQSQRHLVADASHELRTPIAALRSNIQIFLESESLPAGEAAALRDAILAELDELTQIVADVVELARGSTPSDNLEQIELDSIVHEAVARASRRAPQLNFREELEPTVINGAADRVGRAVENVIDNARKWSPDNGVVEVRLRDGTLTVRDHGPGFNETDLPHVFDRFYRADAARRMPGSGLGLAIVQQAAEAHGGRAEAMNAPGGGGLVSLSFGSQQRDRAAVA